MSRGHRDGRERQGARDGAAQGGHARAEAGPGEGVDLDPDLAELLALGNQAMGERIAGVGALEPLGARIGLALRIAPREVGWTERLIEVVERSALAPERKEAITGRLRWDQLLADDVARAVVAAFGADAPEIRSALIAAVESAPAEVPERLAQSVAEQTGLAADRATELVRAIGLARPFWDEDEEEAPPGDYLAETSGS